MTRDELQKLLNDTFGRLDDKQLLALTIYGESRGEGREGMIAVGSVILERVEHRAWDGDTIAEVCLMPYQFSCFLPKDPNFTTLKLITQTFESYYEKSDILRQCCEVAAGLLNGWIPRTPEIAAADCCQYIESRYRRKIDQSAAMATGAKQSEINKKRWWARMKLLVVVGHHEFYA